MASLSNSASSARGAAADRPNYLARGLEIVTALLTAFGGFLLNVAPPDETGVKFAVGLSSFISLIIFLSIAALAQKRLRSGERRYWFAVAFASAAVFVGTGLAYRHNFERLTFSYPPEGDEAQVRYVNGTRLTPAAERQLQAAPNSNRAELLDSFGESRRQAVWPQESIDRAGTTLVINYILVVTSLSVAFFCLTEGILLRKR